MRPGSGPIVIDTGTAPEKADRSGPVTGARIILLVQRRPMASGFIASRLKMEESYIRRVCRMLVDAGILRVEIKPQRGTRPLRVYSLAVAMIPVPVPMPLSGAGVPTGMGTGGTSIHGAIVPGSAIKKAG